MKLGLGTYAYAWAIGIVNYPPPQPMDALTFVRRAAALGLSLVQIADNLPLHTLLTGELDALEAEVRRLGIEVEVGTRGIGQEHLKTYLRLAQRFGSPILRVVVDTAQHHPSPEEVVELLRPLMADFEGAGVTLAIENHDRFPVKTLASILEAVGSPRIGICLDTVNSLGAVEGTEAVVETLGRFIANLHVKDFAVRRHDHMLGFIVEGKPAGSGQLDVPWLLDALNRHNRPYNAILELWPPPEATVEATVAKEDAWVVESVAYLRRLIPA